ncbi:MAG: glycosyltransferase family 9 protein [Candidatus Atribacteria bacterium]
MLKILTCILWPKRVNALPKRICIYRIGNIGDIVCAIPAIIAVRKAFPDAHITLLTSPGRKGAVGAKELIEDAWFFDKLWVYYSDDINTLGKTIQFIKKIRHESSDLWITLPAEMWSLKTTLRNMIFIKSCGVKRACGFMISTIKLWANVQNKGFKFDNEVERLIKVLTYYKLPISGEIFYDLPIPSNAKESAERIANHYQLNNSNLFGFVPGAKREINEWPLDYFVEVGRYIIKKFPEGKIVVLGGTDDFKKGEYLKNKLGNNCVVNLAGRTYLLELAYLMKYFQLIVTNNTGPMHMAALEGAKVIGIFSSAELNGKWFPYGNNCKVLMKSIDCEGCYYKCSNDKLCIKAIMPESVKSTIEEMMS